MTLRLPDVTLVIYDVVAHELAALAVEDCMSKVDFAAVHVWTDQSQHFTKVADKIFPANTGLSKAEGQSQLWRDVPRRIETSHVLNVEWDSGIADVGLWDGRFLEYDYVGAPWPFYESLRVGNGGFALVSARLLRFLADHPDEYPYAFPWDDTLCRRHRVRLEAEGFTWAPDDVADRFAFEYGELRPAFGFHDSRNFPAFLAYGDLARRRAAANGYVKDHVAWKVMEAQLRGMSRGMEVTPFGAEHAPVHPAVNGLNALALAQAEARAFEAAVVSTKRAVTVMPTAPDLWANLASHFWQLREFEEARECAMRAIRMDPNHRYAWGNLGLALQAEGDVEGAERAYNTGIARAPDNPKTVYNRGLMYLSEGRYEEGFRDYEARIEKSPEVYPKFKAPFWKKGESLAGKTIFVYAEQGIGDNILFARFLPWLATQAAKVYVYWPTLVLRLTWNYTQIVECVPDGVPIPETDRAVFMGSLPYHYGATVENLPPDPGLIAERVRNAVPGQAMEVPYPVGVALRPFRVGICWTGSPAQERNKNRTVPLEHLIDIASDPRVYLYSLQCGPGQADIARVGVQDFVEDPSDQLVRGGLAATGSAMLQLDLVITCCTSVAHLAGALGIPAWVMLSEDAYWVWGRTFERSPWWPNLRLYRQEKPFEWKPVIARIRADLAEAMVK